jgi:RimJ/RimL family protein N-acetyltransferase
LELSDIPKTRKIQGMSTHTEPTLSGPILEEVAADQCRGLLPSLAAVEMNALFVRAVLTRDAPGRVFVDSAESPSVVYVIHGYGMSLLWGRRDSCLARDRCAAQVIAMARSAPEWLQVWPRSWAAPFAAVPGSRASVDAFAPAVQQHTRVNFRFSREAYEACRPRALAASPRIVRVDRSTFAMAGSVVPQAFWADVEAFLGRGAGFAVMVEGRPVSLAFSSFVTSSQLELGIETVEQHRGRGLARLACIALIDYCLARDLEPLWACRLENRASHRLAEGLGFSPVRQLPYFRLPPAVDLQVLPPPSAHP